MTSWNGRFEACSSGVIPARRLGFRFICSSYLHDGCMLHKGDGVWGLRLQIGGLGTGVDVGVSIGGGGTTNDLK